MTPTQAFRYTADIGAALDALEDVDLVVAHHASLTALAARRFAQKNDIPYVVMTHGTGIEPQHHAGYAPRVWEEIRGALEAASAMIVTTEYVWDDLVKPLLEIDHQDDLVKPLLEIDHQDVLVLPCGVDLDEFHPEGGNDVRLRWGLPERYVICPGALTRLKGPQNVVRASEEYSDLAPTIFLGDGDLRGELETTLGERGRFLGFVSDRDKAGLINAATVLAAGPEKLEHFGVIYVEALAAGTIPAAFAGGGVASIITPEVGVITPRDPVALGQSIRAVLDDEDARWSMAIAARHRAESRYAAEDVGDALESWLSGVAKAATRRPPTREGVA